VHQVEHALPASLIEEVESDVPEESDAIAHVGLLPLIGWSLKRPVHK
jgi:hypothetical protein